MKKWKIGILVLLAMTALAIVVAPIYSNKCVDQSCSSLRVPFALILLAFALSLQIFDVWRSLFNEIIGKRKTEGNSVRRVVLNRGIKNSPVQ